MIRFFEERDKDAVISLWQEAFGDKKEEIARFIDYFKDGLLVLEKDGKIISMLTLIKTSIGTEAGRYVYAVATYKKFRGMGFASELIEFSKQFISDNNEKFLVLVPQGNSLFDFYKKRGFYELCCCRKIEKKVDFLKKTDIIAEIISAKEYFSLRKSYFSGGRYAEWDIKMLEFMKNAYNGSFLAMKKDNAVYGMAFCYATGDLLVIPELLNTENSDTIIDVLCAFFGVGKAFCIKAQKRGEKFAMIYPEEFKDTYFGLAMK